MDRMNRMIEALKARAEKANRKTPPREERLQKILIG